MQPLLLKQSRHKVWWSCIFYSLFISFCSVLASVTAEIISTLFEFKLGCSTFEPGDRWTYTRCSNKNATSHTIYICIDTQWTDYTTRHTPARSDATGAPSYNKRICQQDWTIRLPNRKASSQAYIYIREREREREGDPTGKSMNTMKNKTTSCAFFSICIFLCL